MSHDLKSPLVTIKGFIGFFEKDLKAGELERIPEDMVRIREAAQRMEVFPSGIKFLDSFAVTSNEMGVNWELFRGARRWLHPHR